MSADISRAEAELVKSLFDVKSLSGGGWSPGGTRDPLRIELSIKESEQTLNYETLTELSHSFGTTDISVEYDDDWYEGITGVVVVLKWRKG